MCSDSLTKMLLKLPLPLVTAITVHHGYFWKGEAYPITGMRGKRIKSLIQNDISLVGYHLPLDSHPTLGNNAAIADILELEKY